MSFERLRRALRPALAAAALVAVSAAGGVSLAQEIPEETQKDLWCGLAFTHVATDAPGDATEEQKALAERFAEGGKVLTDRARAVLLESGYSDEALEKHIETLTAEVVEAVDRAAAEPTYSYEECAALLPF